VYQSYEQAKKEDLPYDPRQQQKETYKQKKDRKNKCKSCNVEYVGTSSWEDYQRRKRGEPSAPPDGIVEQPPWKGGVW
jgi:hypothetical protein